MTTILLSIKPQFVEKILSGEKCFEFRKYIPNKTVNKILIYSSYPVCAVVGEAEVLDIISAEPKLLWDMTKKQSGIDSEFFFKYFANKDKACAYKLGKITKYPIAKQLSDFGVKCAPQSFVYIK